MTSASISNSTMRCSGCASSIRRCAASSSRREGAGVLRRREHQDARPVESSAQSQLLQVHQRDAQRHRGCDANSGQFYMTAISGACAGGGYELALATDYIMMADDGSTSVSLPELPLLAVLARHRRPDAAGRQARGATRSRGFFLHHRGRRCGASARSNGASSMRSFRARNSSKRRRARRSEFAARSDRPCGPARNRAEAARAQYRG